jgi:hypothetical protein
MNQLPEMSDEKIGNTVQRERGSGTWLRPGSVFEAVGIDSLGNDGAF